MKDAVAALFEQALDQLIEEDIIQATDRRVVQMKILGSRMGIWQQCCNDARQSSPNGPT